jgi:hypothetical protein
MGMDNIVHADIFFFITTIVTIVVGIFLSVALYYFIGTMRNVREISKIVKDKVEDAGEHLDAFWERLLGARLINFFLPKKVVKSKKK